MYTELYYYLHLVFTAFFYWILSNNKKRLIWLSISSLFFIYHIDIYAFVITIGLTVITHLLGKKIETGSKKKLWLCISLCLLIFVLAIFKYFLIVSKLSQINLSMLKGFPLLRLEQIVIPLGISYLIFKYISYLIDVYYGRTTSGSVLELLVYGSLFTIFGAGPLERFSRLRIQFYSVSESFNKTYLKQAFIRISYGLFKKLVIADWISYFTKPIWDKPAAHLPFVFAIAMVGYSIQIYFDFSAYSDIAIGSSKVFGLNVMENFNNPYLAKNIGDFWRRWHISLSEWIRDYIFLPLSKLYNIKPWLLYLVPLIAMSVCGLWHGKEFHYLLWGLWHGFAIDTFQLFRKTKSKLINSLIKTPLGTITCVTIGWLIFRGFDDINELTWYNYLIVLITLPILLFFVQKIFRYFSGKSVWNSAKTATLFLILAFTLQCLSNTNFMYMNF